MGQDMRDYANEEARRALVKERDDLRALAGEMLVTLRGALECDRGCDCEASERQRAWVKRAKALGVAVPT